MLDRDCNWFYWTKNDCYHHGERQLGLLISHHSNLTNSTEHPGHVFLYTMVLRGLGNNNPDQFTTATVLLHCSHKIVLTREKKKQHISKWLIGLQQLYCEDRLRELGLGLEKRTPGTVLITVFQYLKRTYRRDDRTRDNDFKLKKGGFRLDIRKKFFVIMSIWNMMPREAVNAHLKKCSKSSWMGLWATWCSVHFPLDQLKLHDF